MSKSAKRFALIFISIFLGLGLLGYCLVEVVGEGSTGKEESPMLENIPKASFEYILAQAYAKAAIVKFGGTQKAFENRWQAGWISLENKKYDWAVKVFNRAWLINPSDSRIYNAYGAIFDIKGDKQKAVDWYHKGAEKGDSKSQYNLAEEYMKGKFLRRDYVQGARWYRRAADQNLSWALNMLGICYEYGLGVPRSTAEAKKWYQKADATGNISEQMRLYRGLTQAQITDFQVPPEGQMIRN